jgi:hypothetical protein
MNLGRVGAENPDRSNGEKRRAADPSKLVPMNYSR